MGQRWAAAFRFIGIGWYIGICILGGALGGRWIGQRLDGGSGEVILTIVGLFIGLFQMENNLIKLPFVIQIQIMRDRLIIVFLLFILILGDNIFHLLQTHLVKETESFITIIIN